MIRTGVVFRAVVSVLLLMSGPAEAGGIAKYIQPQPDSPVEITGCGGTVAFEHNQWGTNSSTLTTAVDFKNISTKTAVAVMFRLQMSNAFGDIMDNLFANATGQFAPDAVINGNHWANTDTWPGLGTIRCSVSRVLFSDGTVWKESGDKTSAGS